MKTIKMTLLLCLSVILSIALLAACSPEDHKASTDSDGQDAKIYWNVEKYVYSAKETERMTRDGKYYVRFLVDGEQKDLPVADVLTVNHIDTLEVMGLQFDENGVIVNVIPVEEMGYTIAAEDYFVQSYTASTLVCNAVGNGTALSKTLEINDQTQIYVVDEEGSLLCGMPGSLKEKARVLAVADATGSLTHVYMFEPFVQGDVYWNHTRMYDSTSKTSTRQLDELARYAYEFSVNGEVVTLYTKDQEVANAIDAMAARCMGLRFDEDGYIAEVYATNKMTGGKSWGSWYYILGIDGNLLSGEKFSGSNAGSTTRGVMAKDCKIYDVSGQGAYIGEPTQLQLYDQVHGLRNEFGEISCLFVVKRTYQADIYYNVERQYDSAAKTTKRNPAADGYYYIQLSHKGQQLTLKTKDKDIVTSIDAAAARCFGLKVEKDEILEFYASTSVWGGLQFCSYDYVTAISADGTITAKEAEVAKKGDKTYQGKMLEDCGVYNVSSTATVVGEKTTLQVGDKIHALKNLHGEVTHVFVVGRTYNVPIYWNVSRQYDSTNQTTKRTPNAQGYYEIVLAINGHQKTYKTKSKALMTEIDSIATKCFGLETSGNIITKVYKSSSVKDGAQFCSYDIITALKNGVITAREVDIQKHGAKTYTGKMTKNCKVYNVSGTADVVGEKATVQVGDKIHALKDRDGNVTYVFILSRTYNVPIYWNVNRQYDSESKTTKRVPNAEGYYEILLAVNGQQKTYKTKSLALINELDAVATKCFGLETNGDIITRMYKTAYVNGGTQFCSWDVVTAIKGNTVIAKESDGSGTYTGTISKNTKVYNVTGSGEFVGEKTSLQVGDKIHALKYDGGNINIIYVVSRTEKVVAETGFCQLCDRDVTWYSWDGAVAMEDGKHYFLKHSIGVNTTAYIGAEDQTDVHATLDLRGYDIRAAVRAFRIYGTLNLLDTVGDGVIYGNASGQATGFYVYDAGTFNMYGGTFVGGEVANTQCGIGAVGLKDGSHATFNMYGGNLIGGNTQKDGGNLTMYHSSVFNMYGGTVSDGQTLGAGGNINAGAKAQINLYGGRILGGRAATGDCVYGGKISIYNNAAVVVDNIYLNTPIQAPEALAEGSKVTVTLAAGYGDVTYETPETNLQYISATDGEVLWKNGKLIVLGKPNKTAYCDHCQKVADWYIWDGKYSLDSGMHYYLDTNVTVDSTAYIGSTENREATVCLDLNGMNIDATVRVFRVYGNLNLMDTVGSGVVTGNTGGQASVFYVYEDAVFNLYGGTLTSKKTVTSDNGAGIGGVDKGTMNMYGGMITGGVSKRSGGNLNLYNTGVLNLYGGTIEKGTSLEGSGGNIQMSSSAKLNIYGGNILDGSAANLGNCVNANGAVTLYGRSQIIVTQLRLPTGKTIAVENALPQGSSVGILLASDTGVFTGQTPESNQDCFVSQEYDVAWVDGVLTLREKQSQEPPVEPEDPNVHKHCICGGLGKKGDHVSCTELEWTAWPGVDALKLDGSVSYYLTEDITVDSAIALKEGQSLTLCLNGHAITTTASIYIFDNRGDLTICDHPQEDGSYKGAIINLSDATGAGAHSRVFYLRGTSGGASLRLFGGNLSAPNAKATGTGGTVARAGTSTGTCTFKMYAGKIFGGNASGSAIAGNIVLEKGSTTFLYGGMITGGSNDKGAGNIILKNGAVLNLEGGAITDGTGLDGSNVRVNSGCVLSAVSGAITGGTVYAQGDVTVGDDAIVEEIQYP